MNIIFVLLLKIIQSASSQQNEGENLHKEDVKESNNINGEKVSSSDDEERVLSSDDEEKVSSSDDEEQVSSIDDESSDSESLEMSDSKESDSTEKRWQREKLYKKFAKTTSVNIKCAGYKEIQADYSFTKRRFSCTYDKIKFASRKKSVKIRMQDDIFEYHRKNPQTLILNGEKVNLKDTRINIFKIEAVNSKILTVITDDYMDLNLSEFSMINNKYVLSVDQNYNNALIFSIKGAFTVFIDSYGKNSPFAIIYNEENYYATHRIIKSQDQSFFEVYGYGKNNTQFHYSASAYDELAPEIQTNKRRKLN